jgi:Tfp pilus assembly protein PilF
VQLTADRLRATIAPADMHKGDPVAEADLSALPDRPAQEPVLLQDWTALTRCLDWTLGQMAFQQRGSQAFTTQEVPNLINQGGLPAYRAAEVLFAHCLEVDAAGKLEREIWGMEMALGLGLFSLQLLDRFQGLCRAHGRDYYDRLIWFATDGTPRMVVDARDHGVFARHAGHVVLGLVDALDPARLVRLDSGETVDLTGRLRAVVHTYLLCVLPANLFRRQIRRDEAGIRENWGAVMARTVLRRPEDLALFTPMSVAQVQAAAASDDRAVLQTLTPLYPLVDLELALAGFEPEDLSDGPEIRRIAEQLTDALPAPPAGEADPRDDLWVLHSAGAQHSLGRTLEILRPDGFLYYRDYGPATAQRANGNHLYQHYGATTASGINHFALEGWLHSPGPDGQPRAQVSAPEGEGEASIKNRFISKADLPETRRAFALHFDPRGFAALEQLVEQARQEMGQKDGQPMELFRQALQLERDNWQLLGEAGDVALRRERNFEMAHMLLTEALRINPWYSASTWNSLGDLFWAQNEFAQARQAYMRAAEANTEHYRSYLNLADCCIREGDWSGAVEQAAKAIARDVDGNEAERAQKLLQEAAKRLAEQRQRAAKYRKERQAGSSR